MSINNFFDRYGVEITVSNESDSRKLIALPNKDCDSNREYFGFLPKDIVKVGEIISDSNSWITSPLMSLVFDWMIHKNL